MLSLSLTRIRAPLFVIYAQGRLPFDAARCLRSARNYKIAILQQQLGDKQQGPLSLPCLPPPPHPPPSFSALPRIMSHGPPPSGANLFAYGNMGVGSGMTTSQVRHHFLDSFFPLVFVFSFCLVVCSCTCCRPRTADSVAACYR